MHDYIVCIIIIIGKTNSSQHSKYQSEPPRMSEFIHADERY